jgi:hypothetical protein
LSQSELSSLKDERNELNVALNEVQGGAGAGTAASQIDTSRLKREISRIDSIIDEKTAPSPRAIEKDRLVKEEKELEEAIAEGMPTRFEMRRPSENPGAVRKHIQWGERNVLNIRRYVEIQKILRPHDPKSIEVLRKDK